MSSYHVLLLLLLCAAQVACALFGIVAVDIKHGPMMRSYAWLVAFLLTLDTAWHHFWAERLLRNYTGVREEHEMWWGIMVANTNKVCGFGMEIGAAILRLLSLPVWYLLWHGGYISGNAIGGGYENYSAIPAASAHGFPEHLKPPGPL